MSFDVDAVVAVAVVVVVALADGVDWQDDLETGEPINTFDNWEKWGKKKKMEIFTYACQNWKQNFTGEQLTQGT